MDPSYSVYEDAVSRNKESAARGVVELELPAGVRVRGLLQSGYQSVLTREALEFVADLERRFRPRVKYVLACRREEQARYDAGELPGFDPATKAIREGDWVCSAPPPAIADRRVEITGPVERKMIINALNCGAKMFMVSVPLIVTSSILLFPFGPRENACN
jgi:malate synthase